jgi:hypothetical protein
MVMEVRNDIASGDSKVSVAMAGFIPAISLRQALCLPDRDARDKRGHDGY